MYSDEGTGRDRSPPRLAIDVPNATAHTSTASVLGVCGKPKFCSDSVFKKSELSKNVSSVQTVFRQKLHAVAIQIKSD